MRMSDEFASVYLNAATIDKWGGKVQVTISGVETLTFGQGQQQVKKAVLSFEETELKWPANMTNRNILVGLLGDETDDWMGHPIILYTQPDTFQGRPVRKIMCRRGQVAAATAQPRRSNGTFQSPSVPSAPSPPARKSVPQPPPADDGETVSDDDIPY